VWLLKKSPMHQAKPRCCVLAPAHDNPWPGHQFHHFLFIHQSSPSSLVQDRTTGSGRPECWFQTGSCQLLFGPSLPNQSNPIQSINQSVNQSINQIKQSVGQSVSVAVVCCDLSMYSIIVLYVQSKPHNISCTVHIHGDQ